MSATAPPQPVRLLLCVASALVVACTGMGRGGESDPDATAADAFFWPDQFKLGDLIGDLGVPDLGDILPPTCGGIALPFNTTPPNMLVVFDRSCSMRRKFDKPAEFGTGPTDPSTRWFVARQAVDQLTRNFQTRLRFGLMVFPRPRQGCGDIPSGNVPCDRMTRNLILSELDKQDTQPFTLCTKPGSSIPGEQPHVTPTAEALEGVLRLPELQDPNQENVVLLFTDGQATCDATAASLGTLTQKLLGLGISTTVVGFGDAGTANAAAMLESIAKAGGRPAQGSGRSFWLASDPAQLQQALESIAVAAVSCRFTLEEMPPDTEKLFVLVDSKELPKDSPDGWRYDSASNGVVLQGEACGRLRRGEVLALSVVFGCPDPVCVPQEERCDGLDNNCNGDVDEGCVK